MAKLLQPVDIAGLNLKNRVVMPPMCMYAVSKQDGKVTPFHQAHYGARAIGQVGLIFLEATAVSPDGRISNQDLGLWSDDHLDGMGQLVFQVHQMGSRIGVQLSHAGRKAKDAYRPLSPSSLAFSSDYPTPHAMTLDEINSVQVAFVDAAKRAQVAGFDAIEIHGAHGYLINQFLEPATNQRQDQYGGSLDNRYRFLGEIVRQVREVFTGSLWVRLSMTAYLEDGQQNSLTDYQQIGQWLQADGVDCLDISTGGLVNHGPNIPVYPGYQLPFVVKMKEAVDLPVAAVGFLNRPELGEYLLQTGQADLIMVGRSLLRQSNWVTEAAIILRESDYNPYNDSYRRGMN
ncbi:NADH:flavin oxidoreductase/NADH oxidase [Vaginisenegalia massiliensis]|uniref:NADH:flavin oxidoreductase/NADH oxidase n=1 Tax=Vaginisenegalia massiliensis TaxID=2058294 RepID=UPI000F53B92D|nr:NADH:flavin oxidoreductase/NADH oxidase [Vaginisenegalia massiliensis]